MTIAIPMSDGRLCVHFGHCERFLLADVDEARKRIIGISYLTPPPHEPGVLPRWLRDRGVNLVISGGMGRRARDLFHSLGIRVVVGAPADTPEEIVASFLAGNLVVGENVCDH